MRRPEQTGAAREDRRQALVRAAYNEIDLAREAVDKVVSMIGGRDPRLIAPGLRPLEEDKLQRQFDDYWRQPDSHRRDAWLHLQLDPRNQS